jgi:hypothetical protein
MKTLTTLTAIAALVAGVSVAQAQMGSPPSGSSMQKAQTVGNSPFLHTYVSGRRPELQICKHGSLRKRRETSKPELFAKSEQEHDRLETIITWEQGEPMPKPRHGLRRHFRADWIPSV